MKKIYTFLLAFGLIQGAAFAQDSLQVAKKPKTPIGGRPNIPSDLKIEFGFNQLNNRSEDIGLNFFGSRTFNVYYQYPFPIFGENSGYTIDLGIGIGSDKYAFKDDQTLYNVPELGPESSELKDIRDVLGDDIQINKNVVATNYIDIPIDFTYHANKNNYTKGFTMSVGAKVGYLYESHTKVKYENSDGLKRKVKDSQNYGFEKFRYGISLKAGTPGFYVWGYYGLNKVFQEGLGPNATEANQINFGVAVNLF
ncbi:porin family protein [Algoriphagus halophytocola]|uniref:PorT family protein n=1 Tax=Algoriphagus halophytocola TaxID=2991499 RepID=A0ABY6ML03_9BACT|nr:MULTISPECIES: porin family protein [unclassified Algoriphagus]UZD24455.1 PorT family protein [Algoriphagus sp. TR-M5]WBL41819.1 porin family protein [Algoriphagus sp. TR-M9]